MQEKTIGQHLKIYVLSQLSRISLPFYFDSVGTQLKLSLSNIWIFLFKMNLYIFFNYFYIYVNIKNNFKK
jgi:hypothetical protein